MASKPTCNTTTSSSIGIKCRHCLINQSHFLWFLLFFVKGLFVLLAAPITLAPFPYLPRPWLWLPLIATVSTPFFSARLNNASPKPRFYIYLSSASPSLPRCKKNLMRLRCRDEFNCHILTVNMARPLASMQEALFSSEEDSDRYTCRFVTAVLSPSPRLPIFGLLGWPGQLLVLHRTSVRSIECRSDQRTNRSGVVLGDSHAGIMWERQWEGIGKKRGSCLEECDLGAAM